MQRMQSEGSFSRARNDKATPTALKSCRAGHFLGKVSPADAKRLLQAEELLEAWQMLSRKSHPRSRDRDARVRQT